LGANEDDALVDHPQSACRREGQVKHPAGFVGPTVVDHDDRGAAAARIGYENMGAKRQSAMRRRKGRGIEAASIGEQALLARHSRKALRLGLARKCACRADDRQTSDRGGEDEACEKHIEAPSAGVSGI
jgi:hypothetical protein